MTTSLLFLLFQSSETPQVPSGLAAGLGMGIVIVYLAVLLLLVASLWKVFVKAGKPGWAAIVPIYNLFVLAEIAGKPSWWGLLMLIPFVGIIMFIIVCISLAERFGKSAGFGVGLGLLGPIFFPILGFGDSQYR
ncbi:MAG TPA: DUF5684 domain-containing protein [Thermoanaerobaculia bacterium]|nr:DUF5684 domain-containing protein [Thermoanaerobaculia bacterium]